MHYKNGRAAKDGDSIVCLNNGNQVAGILYLTQPGATSCNGRLAHRSSTDPYITVGECLHLDDVKAASVPDSTLPKPASDQVEVGK